MKDKIIKINESTSLILDLKTLIIVISFAISLCSVYFSLKADIKLAMENPPPTLSATEWEMKDQNIRLNVQQTLIATENNAKGIEDIKKQLTIIEGRLYDINNLMAH